jgi:hypothetical protein
MTPIISFLDIILVRLVSEDFRVLFSIISLHTPLFSF